MTLWRYQAIPAQDPSGQARQASNFGAAALQRGELAADSAAEVRAALRRIGLQVVDLRALRRSSTPPPSGAGLASSLRSALSRHLRRRRLSRKAELFDALATMLDAGLPLSEAVAALARSSASRGPSRTMLRRLHESLRSGRSLAEAMSHLDAWFDPPEVATVRAGEFAAELGTVLRSLADRHQRAEELGRRLAAALVYPTLVLCVGIGVVIFLSTRTLPQLVGILEQARVPVPALTRAVMGTGAFLASWWHAIAVAAILLSAAAVVGSDTLARRRLAAPMWLRRIVPGVFRRACLAQVCSSLSELMRSGVPLVEALRVLAPTTGGPVGSSLRARLLDAADRLERGEDLPAALHDPLWFDDEFRQLLSTGQTSGELPALLARVGDRYQRSARRAIDRLTSLLEPAVILALAALIGTVVMGAVLPMLRLQEVIR